MNQYMVVGSFVFFLVAFTLVGILSARKKQATSEDYLVASRNVNPWLTALSAVSTNNSGYMFIGLIGFAWRDGLEAIWITIGFVVGDFLTWLWVHRRVRAQSEAVGASSVPSLLATDHLGRVSRPIAIATGALTFFFLGGYAAAQLKAGSATLTALFGWPLWAGSVIGVFVVVIYCFSGGIRASIWTDSVQSVVMIVSMALLLGYCFLEVGGIDALFTRLTEIDPKLVEWTPRGLKFGVLLYLIGFVFAGIGTVGQPHILIRFMAIDAVDSIKKARNIYFVWYTLFSIAALAVGLYARVILPNLTRGLEGAAAISASEGALPTMAVALLPSILVGVMLAGIFSATMSTADSQILSCSAAVTQDMFPRWQESYTASKVATLSVAGVALAIALFATSGVFSLVLVAWSALASTLGPLLLIRLAKLPLPTPLGLAMIGVGLATVFLWGASDYAGDIFKAMPGMLFPLALYWVVMAVVRPKTDKQDS